MKSLLAALLFTVALGASAVAVAQTPPTIVTPSDLKWGPGTGGLAGTQIAVIAGDPSKPGPYTVRLKVPDGAKVTPHFHGDDENITVLSGTLLVGVGDTMDTSKMTTLPAGSYALVPKGLHHYAMAKGETILQLTGNGPMTMTPAGAK